MPSLDGDALLRINRAVERFEDEWRRCTPGPIEDLLRGEADDRTRGELLRYALAVELEYRRRLGEVPTAAEYERRFPGHVEAVRVAFAEQITITVPSGSTVDAIPFALDWPALDPVPDPATLGKYEVLRRLGDGGQGSAFLVRDPELGQLVVLKRYHAAGDDAAREARNLCRVRSPYTAQCRDLMHHEGELFLVMEYIPGRPLSEILKEGRPTPEVAVRLAEQLAEGLEAVHACGLIHRDLKPSNVVIGDDGTARLVDFGLAAHLGSAELDKISGTPQYMSPEQARGHGARIDFRTDLYGLVGVLYAMLTGKPPHPGKDSKAALEHARSGVVAPPRSINRSIPPALERIVMKALSADPVQRHASASELRRSLRRYRNRHWVRAVVGFAGLVVLLGISLTVYSRLHPTAASLHEGVQKVPMRIESFEVKHFRGDPEKHLGSIGKVSFAARVEDHVRVSARLSTAGYCYLLALNPDGTIQFCPKLKEGTPPELTTEIHYPIGEKDVYGLTDGAGLQAFVLIVSQQPLPAFNAWPHSAVFQWKPTANPSEVWRFEGRHLVLMDDPNRGIERQVESTAPVPLTAVCNILRNLPGIDADEVVAFPVKP